MKGIKHKRIRIVMAAIPCLLLIFLFTGQSIAATDDEIKAVLLENDDLFVNNDLFISAFRTLGWWCVKGLAWMAARCGDLFDVSFKLIDFTSYSGVTNYINSFRVVFVALMSASLVFLGIILIFYHEKGPKIIVNVLIALLVISSGTYMINSLNNLLANDIRSAVMGKDESVGSSAMVYEIVANSIYDLVYLDKQYGLMNITKTERSTYSTLSEQDLGLIKINEIVKPDEVSAEAKDLMSKKIRYLAGGETELLKSYNGVAWTDLLNEYYYRYKVIWFNVIIGLISVLFVYVCMAYKVTRLLYEIVIHHILAYLYSSNLTSNQKVLKVIDGLKDSYITLFIVLICMRVYMLAYYYINNMLVASSFAKAVLLLFIAFIVSDGPNIVQKLTGIDAGLSGGLGKLIAATHVARTMSRMVTAGAGLFSKDREKNSNQAMNGKAGIGNAGNDLNESANAAVGNDTPDIEEDKHTDNSQVNVGGSNGESPGGAQNAGGVTDSEGLESSVGSEAEASEATPSDMNADTSISGEQGTESDAARTGQYPEAKDKAEIPNIQGEQTENPFEPMEQNGRGDLSEMENDLGGMKFDDDMQTNDANTTSYQGDIGQKMQTTPEAPSGAPSDKSLTMSGNKRTDVFVSDNQGSSKKDGLDE